MAVNIKKEFGNTRVRKPDLTTLIYGKIPPQATDFEEAVLGSCLGINGRLIFESVLGIIDKAECFYADAHQKIYAAMIRLYDKGTPIDLMLVTEELRKSNELELVGGGYYLATLVGKVVTDANIEYHCRIIIEKFLQRELIRISGSIIGDAYDDSTDVFELLDKGSDELYKLLSGNIQSEPKSALHGVKEVADIMEMQKNASTDLTGIPTPFSELNDLTNGLQKSDLIIIAARPSVGKTAFTLSLCSHAADEMYPVLIFSLEMSRQQLISRLIASKSEVELKKILRPKLLELDEWDRVHAASADVAKLPIYIDDTAGIGLAELRAKCRKMKTKYGIELVCVDYLQLMSGAGNEGNREQEISKISRGLKNLGKDLNVPVIALSQLNRSMENTNGEATRDPRLSDLRESGAIEQDADNVFFLANPTLKMISENNWFADKINIIAAKGRNIGLSTISVGFNKPTQRFYDPNAHKFNAAPQQPPQNPAAGITPNYNRPPANFWNETN